MLKIVNCFKSLEKVCRHGHCAKDAAPTFFETLNNYNSCTDVYVFRRHRENFRYARAGIDKRQAKCLRFRPQSVRSANECLAFANC